MLYVHSLDWAVTCRCSCSHFPRFLSDNSTPQNGNAWSACFMSVKLIQRCACVWIGKPGSKPRGQRSSMLIRVFVLTVCTLHSAEPQARACSDYMGWWLVYLLCFSMCKFSIHLPVMPEASCMTYKQACSVAVLLALKHTLNMWRLAMPLLSMSKKWKRNWLLHSVDLINETTAEYSSYLFFG